jgi:hypothetical protein
MIIVNSEFSRDITEVYPTIKDTNIIVYDFVYNQDKIKMMLFDGCTLVHNGLQVSYSNFKIEHEYPNSNRVQNETIKILEFVQPPELLSTSIVLHSIQNGKLKLFEPTIYSDFTESDIVLELSTLD